MKLFGTITSPFVRRVRVVAAASGEPIELVDTATDAGQAALRAITPIGKVPVAELDGRLLFDSRIIIDWLVVHRGYGTLTPPADAWAQANLVNAIDSALEAAISLFYLRRDGVAVDGSVFAQRQVARTTAIFAWLETRLSADGRRLQASPADGTGLDLATLSLLCTLDWMDFRNAYPTAQHPGLASVRAAWAGHDDLVATRPHA